MDVYPSIGHHCPRDLRIILHLKNKAKQKEQKSRRLIDPEKGLVVTKGEGLGRMRGEQEGD